MLPGNTKSIFSTFLGVMALVLWGFNALCAVELKELPLFEYLFLVLLAGFLFTAVKLTFEKRWGDFLKYKKECLAAGVLLTIFELCYYSAFRYAPPVQVDLVNYLWPLFILLGTSMLPGERFSWIYLLSGCLAFFAIFLLLTSSEDFGLLQASCWKGYLFAFVGALFWAGFSLYSRHQKQLPSDLIGIYCGIGAFCFGILHFSFDSFVVPTGNQTCILAFTGFGTTAAAFWFWDWGMKRGNYRFLTLLSYFTSSFSVGLLILFKKAEPNPVLGLSCGLIVFSSALPKLLEIFKAPPAQTPETTLPSTGKRHPSMKVVVKKTQTYRAGFAATSRTDSSIRSSNDINRY